MVERNRFWSKVEKTDMCWLWTGVKRPAGYGRFGGAQAHRVAYELLVGPIPAGLELDHLCRVPGCVNPAHLEPVTKAENRHREHVAREIEDPGWRRRRKMPAGPKFQPQLTHCRKAGHPFDEANTAYLANGNRRCRACHRERNRVSKQRSAAP